MRKAILNVTVESRKSVPATFRKPSERCKKAWMFEKWEDSKAELATADSAKGTRRKEAKLWLLQYPQCMP
jgi:hypothetical protein